MSRRIAAVIGKWRLAPRLLRARIAGGGPAADCDGSCCRHGAYVSLVERDRILARAAGIGRQMDDSQSHDPATWFSRRLHHDGDFPDGVAVGTRVHGGRCVFRRRDGLCAIHRFEERARSLPDPRLKPFYCRLFPLTTDGCRVDYDPLIAGKRPCCTLARGGETPGVVAWRDEFRMLVGEPGLRRLRALRRLRRRRRAEPRR